MKHRASRGRYAKSAERRTSIAAALHLNQQNVHADVTVAHVATKAAVSERALFYHFPTRDHVLVAALKLSDELTVDDMAGRDPGQLSDIDQVVAALARLDAGHVWKVRNVT